MVRRPARIMAAQVRLVPSRPPPRRLTGQGGPEPGIGIHERPYLLHATQRLCRCQIADRHQVRGNHCCGPGCAHVAVDADHVRWSCCQGIMDPHDGSGQMPPNVVCGNVFHLHRAVGDAVRLVVAEVRAEARVQMRYSQLGQALAITHPTVIPQPKARCHLVAIVCCQPPCGVGAHLGRNHQSH